MKLKIISIYMFSIILSGCSSIFKSNDKIERSIIPLDTLSIESFSNLIRDKYSNYSEMSRLNDNKRGPCGTDFSSILMISRAERCNIVLYSFNRQDSCVMFSDSLVKGNYEIPHKSLRVPEGYYILKFGGESIIYLPPA